MDAAARDYLLLRSDRRTSMLSVWTAFRLGDIAQALPGRGEELLDLVEAIWDEAHADGFDDGRDSGYDEGFDEGKDEGRREAEAEAALKAIKPAGESDDGSKAVQADSDRKPGVV